MTPFTPSTAEAIRQVGALPVLVALLLSLAVVVLRLAAVPLAAAANGLDVLADLAARPMAPVLPAAERSPDGSPR